MVKPQETDRLSIDLHLDAANVNRLLSLNWRCQSGLVQNMESMVQEFKDSRQLQVGVQNTFSWKLKL